MSIYINRQLNKSTKVTSYNKNYFDYVKQLAKDNEMVLHVSKTIKECVHSVLRLTSQAIVS